MVNNQRGSALVIVLLMMVILSVLGLSLLGSMINDAKQTVFREDEIVSVHDAERALDEAIAMIKIAFEKYEDDYVSIKEHNDIIQTLSGEHNLQDGEKTILYTIEDVTEEVKDEAGNLIIDVDNNLTRKLLISVTNSNRVFEQVVYISAIPSFLHYAVSSNSDIYLNGGSTINGNIYVGENLYVKNEAEYKFTADPNFAKTTFPFLEGLIFKENKSEQVHFLDVNYPIDTSYTATQNLDLPFLGNSTDFGFIEEEFNKVNIRRSFIDKLIQVADVRQISDLGEVSKQLINNNDLENEALYDELVMKSQFVDFTSYYGIGSAVYNGDVFITNKSEYDIPDNTHLHLNHLDIPDNQWLIINGNLFIEPDSDSQLEIDGNILVTGNIEINGGLTTGKVAFDSTIICLGQTLILNVEIQRINQGALILFSEGMIDIARIKEFSPKDDKNELNTFLYTDSEAILYGVGSNIKIVGGIYAKENLTLNAFRGNVTFNNSDNEFIFVDSLGKNESRFVIDHNREILTKSNNSKAYQGLPRTEQINIIVDRRVLN